MSGTSGIAVAGLVMVFGVASLQAQKEGDMLARPHLQAGADSNSAVANYEHGLRVINEDPQESYRAFYWATRIDPTSAQAWYGRWVARYLIMSSRDFADAYDYSITKRTPDQLAVDSLRFRALALDPFLYQSLMRPFMQRLITAREADSYPGISAAQTNNYAARALNINSYVGWKLYSDGRFEEALKADANRLGSGPLSTKLSAHTSRADLFVHLSKLDSARAEIRQAIALSPLRNRKDLIIITDSTTMLERELGAIDEMAKRPDDAKVTYARILGENASFYPAHVRLSSIALLEGDTAAAVSEAAAAVAIEPSDPVLRYSYALTLVDAKRDADAAAELRKTIALDPYYAAPHLLMASIADVEDYKDDAMSQYRSFISLAAKSDGNMPRAQDRLSKLIASAPAKP
jgi:tetratricopeptide (TPR) repeat protein